MKYLRFLVSGLICCVAIIHLSVSPSYSTDDQVKLLEEKVRVLEMRIDRLERNVNRRFMAIENKALPPQNPQAELEKEAGTELNNIKILVSNEQIDEAKARLAEFFKKYGSTKTVNSARKFDQELAVFGKDVPENWGIEEWFQDELDLNAEKQNTMVLIFWEVWCGYCRQYVPKLQEVYDTYQDKDLKVVGFTKINKSATPEKVKEFIKDQSLTYSIAKEDGSLSQYFNVQGIPAAALISKGKIVWRGHPARLPDQLIQKYLNM